MQCRACGTEIADKAIVCFRCGAPTLEVAASPRPGQAGASRVAAWVPWLAAALAGVAGLVVAFLAFEGAGGRLAVVAGGAALGTGAWWGLRQQGRRKRRVG